MSVFALLRMFLLPAGFWMLMPFTMQDGAGTDVNDDGADHADGLSGYNDEDGIRAVFALTWWLRRGFLSLSLSSENSF